MPCTDNGRLVLLRKLLPILCTSTPKSIVPRNRDCAEHQRGTGERISLVILDCLWPDALPGKYEALGDQEAGDRVDDLRLLEDLSLPTVDALRFLGMIALLDDFRLQEDIPLTRHKVQTIMPPTNDATQDRNEALTATMLCSSVDPSVAARSLLGPFCVFRFQLSTCARCKTVAASSGRAP